MTPGDRPNKQDFSLRLQQLTAAAMSGELSADELRELDQLLRASDAALDSYLKTCQLDADLRFHAHASRSSRRALDNLPTLAAPELESDAQRGISIQRWFAAMAASILVAFCGWWVSSQWQEIPAERQPQPIARLAESDDAHWLGDDGPRVGHEFVEGDSVYLTKGRARISMSSGAEVVLRSPCFVTLSAANRVQLEEGVVTAQVAEWGQGFTVVTNAMNVVDLGTKFAVAASSHGVSEAHVLDGQVRIQPVGTTSANRRSMLLSGGEALRVEAERKVATRLKADPQRYDAEMGDLPPLKPILIHNTGKGLVPGDEDPHWRISAGPKCMAFDGPQFAVVCNADVRYLANDRERSQWISVTNPVRPGVPPSTEFTFETSFELTGYDVSTVTIAAQVIADNGIRAVRVNGLPLPLVSWNLNEPYQLFNRFELIEIREHLVPGVNRVEFDVWNGVDRSIAAAPNPIAIRVEWQAYGRPLQASIGDTAAARASDQLKPSSPLALWRQAGATLVID